MDLIHSDEAFSISWYDPDHKIVLAHIHTHWNWDDADKLFSKMDEIFLSFTHDAYSVYVFDHGANIFPEGKSALQNMRKHLAVDPPNLRLVLVVNSGKVVETILQIVFSAYRLLDTSSKFRFVRTLGQALQAIAEYEAQHPYSAAVHISDPR